MWRDSVSEYTHESVLIRAKASNLDTVKSESFEFFDCGNYFLDPISREHSFLNRFSVNLISKCLDFARIYQLILEYFR